MSLTIGSGPLSSDHAGRLSFALPDRVVVVDPHPRRVRALIGGQVVVDSDDVKLVHVSGRLPSWAIPAKHVDLHAEPSPDVPDHVVVPWDAVDAWFEEDERVFVHPKDPYHRVDTFPTSRRVRIALDGVELAASTRTIALYETSLPVRYYVPRADVHLELIERSATQTECPYKGTADHWSAVIGGRVTPDVAWSYEHHVLRDAEAVRGHLAFYDDRVDVTAG
ncbi:MAG: hypothetical protein V7636_645 [Actinomycetota bacterium]|jgi:uncharacterized protein (DUF427 family)